MNAGFYIARKNYLGHFGPLIDLFQEKGAEVTLLCDYSKPSMGYKAYLFPDTAMVQDVFKQTEVVSFSNMEEFIEIVRVKDIQVIFFIAIDSFAQEILSVLGENKDVLLAHIQSGGDIILKKNLSAADVIYIFAERWKKRWKDWLLNFKIVADNEKEIVFDQIDAKSVVSGFPQLDQQAYFDRSLIFKKYGIPPDKKIVVLLPFPWRMQFCVWSHIFYKHQNKFLKIMRLLWHRRFKDIYRVLNSVDDMQVAKAIRKFADRNNAFFIVKGSAKNKVPEYLQDIADKVITEGSYYPYAIMELMFVADICIHYYSEAVKECVACNTPSICLGPTKREDWTPYAPRFSVEDFSYKPGNYYNFDGVVYNESVDEFAADFGEKSFNDYPLDPQNHARFVQSFLGYSDLKSSQRIYNDIFERLRNIHKKPCIR